MKKLATLIILFAGVIGYSQDIEPTFEAEGNLVKATYYYEDGSISTQGYFLDKALTGEWTRFDRKGNKTQIAYYDNGKKVGKWFVWGNKSLKEINYSNNAVVNVNLWKQEGKLAQNR
jgi:antitoxin component YwqK of YwqJK toxin-antitoxin module